MAKQQGDESDSELKVRCGMICVVSCNERSDVTGGGALASSQHTTPPHPEGCVHPHPQLDQVRRNLQRSLAFKIQKLSNTFRGQQKEYLGKLRAQKEGTLGQVRGGVEDVDVG